MTIYQKHASSNKASFAELLKFFVILKEILCLHFIPLVPQVIMNSFLDGIGFKFAHLSSQ